MNLKSCSSCGVVIDLDQVDVPPKYDINGIIVANCIWDGNDHCSIIPCPVCKAKIPVEGTSYE